MLLMMFYFSFFTLLYFSCFILVQLVHYVFSVLTVRAHRNSNNMGILLKPNKLCQTLYDVLILSELHFWSHEIYICLFFNSSFDFLDHILKSFPILIPFLMGRRQSSCASNVAVRSQTTHAPHVAVRSQIN